MVKGFAMEKQDKRMCKSESTSFSGVTIDYNHRGYDEDCFGDILNMFDFPMESLEGDGFAEDWAAKLGPIPSEVFKELVPPVTQIGIGIGNSYGSSTDLPFEYPIINNRNAQPKYQYQVNLDEVKPFKDDQNSRISQLKQHPTYMEHKPQKAAFEAPSPNSVLENRSSSSNNSKGISFGIEISIPVRTRTKRLRPTTNPWLMSANYLILPNKNKKQKKPVNNSNMETKRSLLNVGMKKCAHCEITKTPQWREGPTGPKTLCNACGVRYRSGRLYPEYRPAASPTFVPSLHSNSHRKVIEMRQKGV